MARSQSLVDLSGLQWVRGELDQNLERVHQFIEAFIESPEDKLPLQRSVIELHQARGILAMVRLHGAALLAEELRQAVHEVMHGTAENAESIFDVVLGGAVQLSDYLDLIQTESADSALVFHPLINELRVARSKPVVSESELFVRFLMLEPPVVDLPSLEGRDAQAVSADAKSFQMHFQTALLGVLKDSDTQANFLRLTQICQQLLKSLSAPEVYQQWMFLEAVLEGLVDRGLEASLDIKRLLGKMGMLLKYLATEGQESPNAHDMEVAYALLYYVGRSSSQGEKILAVRAACELEQLLPDSLQLEKTRERLRGPNTTLLQTLSSEIRKDIGMVKDNLDLLLRAGDKAPDRLDETVSTIRRVATTLDMLGMGALQRVVNRQAEVVDKRRHEAEPDQREWLDAAVSLLWVEHSLDELLFRHVHPDAVSGEAPPEEPDGRSISPLELREGAASILREALANITRIKELSNRLLTASDAETVEEMVHLLHEMSAGLSVIGVDEAEVQTVEKLREYVMQPAFRYIGREQERLSEYADAISSLEVYLLSLQGHQSNASDLLHKCNDYVAKLQPLELPDDHTEEPVPLAETAPAAEVAALPVSDQEVDPEIKEIFLEEVAEIQEMLADRVPHWSHHVEDEAALGDIRRAFHTLKGSGRMAGAGAIGDYGWAIEQVLNACLDGSLSIDHTVVGIVKNAAEHLGELIDAFAGAKSLPATARQIIVEAHRITDTQPPAHMVAADAQSEEDELWAIFSKDAEQHLGNLQHFLEASGADMLPQLVPPELIRAFHTLKSGARIVGAMEMSHLAADMEALADAIRATGKTMGSETIRLVVTVTEAMSRTLAARGSTEAAGVDMDALGAQAKQQLADLPAEAESTDRELMVIFTDETCDLIENIETALSDWQEAPEDEHYPRQILEYSDNLADTAKTARVAPISMVGQELSRLIQGWQDSEPGKEHIAELANVVSGVYDILDRLRQGAQVEQAGDLISRLQHLASIEFEPAATTEPTPQEEVSTAPVEHVSAVRATEKPAAKEHMDEELLALFIAEGEEILESIGQELDAWERQPDNKGSLLELMRLLHTLKGSARMAGANRIGDLSHQLEDDLTELARTGANVDAPFFAKLHTVNDDIHHALSAYKEGSVAESTAPVPEVPSPEPETTLQEEERFEAERVESIIEPSLDSVVESMDTAEDASTLEEKVAEPHEVETEVPEESSVVEPARRAEPARMPMASETARVSVNQLDQMFNEAGEVGIYLGRMEKQQADLKSHLGEMAQAISQMRERIRQLDIEAESQMQAGKGRLGAESESNQYDESFDPLEMDRFTRMNELSRSLNESAADLVSLQTLMEEVTSSNETLLLQQGRITSNLQHGLMNTMLVPFAGLVQRLQRTVRQTAQAYGKQARIEFDGAENELDRNVLERMAGPLEHLLRNAVVHGIEKPEARQAASKPEQGCIRVSLRRDGTQSIIEVSDDGAGIKLASIRRTAIEQKLIAEDAELSELELVQMIFEPGFSTADSLTHEAGRGVGMDVVNAEIKQLGGSLNVSFDEGRGTQFLIRIPSSLALTQALLVRVGQESFAIGMAAIDGIERLPRNELPRYLEEEGPQVLYGGQGYQAIRLGDLINAHPQEVDDEESKNIPVLLLRAGDTRLALVVDQVLGGEELIVKSLGPQVSAIPGISGGTILADGGVVLIIDVANLYQTRHRRVLSVSAPAEQAEVRDERPLIMVVDDSITIRRVTERFLGRHGYRVDTAKDGMDALPKLQAERPGVVLLDVEMPRIDGFEVATYMRNNEHLRDVPIIMITSRSGEKHRQRAAEIGVDRYLIKPYQEDELLSNLESVLKADEAHGS